MRGGQRSAVRVDQIAQRIKRLVRRKPRGRQTKAPRRPPRGKELTWPSRASSRSFLIRARVMPSWAKSVRSSPCSRRSAAGRAQPCLVDRRGPKASAKATFGLPFREVHPGGPRPPPCVRNMRRRSTCRKIIRQPSGSPPERNPDPLRPRTHESASNRQSCAPRSPSTTPRKATAFLRSKRAGEGGWKVLIVDVGRRAQPQRGECTSQDHRGTTPAASLVLLVAHVPSRLSRDHPVADEAIAARNSER